MLQADPAALKFLLEDAQDGVWLWELGVDPKGRFSPRFLLLLGYPPPSGASSSLAWADILHRDDAPALTQALLAHVEHGDIFDETVRYRRRDGGTVWARCRAFVLRDGAGQPTALLGANHDITARIEARNQLLEQEIELRELLARREQTNAWLELSEELGHVGHWHITLPDHALYWSQEVYRMHGLTVSGYQPEVSSAIGFYHPEDRALVTSAVTAAIETGTDFDFMARLCQPDGTLRHVRARGLVRRDAKGAPAAVFGAVVDITQYREAEAALRHANARLDSLAHSDALTGLANRRRFDERLAEEWKRAARDRAPLSLVLIDLDRFKAFNDTYGHQAGDSCLRAMGAVLAGVARRPGDLAARYGGEEFALLLPATDQDGAVTLADAAREALVRLKIAHAGNVDCGGTVTASFGVATAYPAPDSRDPGWAELLADADLLLYEAKRSGRNRVVASTDLVGGTPPLHPREPERLAALAPYQRKGALRRSSAMDRIARLAAILTGTPIGLVSLVTEQTQVFAGNFGLEDLAGTGRDIAFCAHSILAPQPLVVADAAHDGRFAANKLVTGAPGIRYYAGAPILCPRTGLPLGAVCVIDRAPHPTTPHAHRALLTDLASMAALLLNAVDQTADPLLPTI